MGMFLSLLYLICFLQYWTRGVNRKSFEGDVGEGRVKNLWKLHGEFWENISYLTKEPATRVYSNTDLGMVLM